VIKRKARRPAAKDDAAKRTIADRLERCYASAVHDVMRTMGLGNTVLPPTIKPIDPAMRVAGEIYTFSGHIDQTLSRDETLHRWARFLSRAPRGKVIVCQPNSHAIAFMGELSARALLIKGTRGYVVDGPYRDAPFLREMGFRVFGTTTTPADIVERWTPDALGEPITIGTVTIRSGDYLLGDADGVVIIPADMAARVVAETERVVATESDMRRAILDGMDPEKAYLKFRKF
jgi:regulator of RNase E activity RraA